MNSKESTIIMSWNLFKIMKLSTFVSLTILHNSNAVSLKELRRKTAFGMGKHKPTTSSGTQQNTLQLRNQGSAPMDLPAAPDNSTSSQEPSLIVENEGALEKTFDMKVQDIQIARNTNMNNIQLDFPSVATTSALATNVQENYNQVISSKSSQIVEGASYLSSRSVDTKDDSDEEYKRAMFKTMLTVACAGIFGMGVIHTKGLTSGLEFFSGYLIEQSLSIDNLFVFIMLFDYFKIPMELQNRVLSWGIGGAVLLRGLMIGVGVAALQKFRSVTLVFAAILVASSINLLLEESHHEDNEASDENVIMKFTKFIFPNTSSELHGEKFFIDDGIGKKIATPLFLCLVCVELSDFVFAVDSIPAVLGVSKDPLIVYASNIFAILALRSLYTVVAKAVENFHYLKPAVALVLGFVGSKMIGEYFHFEIGTGASLAIITSLLGGGIGASIFETRRRNCILAPDSL